MKTPPKEASRAKEIIWNGSATVDSELLSEKDGNIRNPETKNNSANFFITSIRNLTRQDERVAPFDDAAADAEAGVYADDEGMEDISSTAAEDLVPESKEERRYHGSPLSKVINHGCLYLPRLTCTHKFIYLARKNS